jgi:PhnB protein
VALTPYLFFDGRCEEAIEFYKKTLGAEVQMLMRFKDGPDQNMCAPGNEDKVMHACVRIGGTPLMLSDGRAQNNPRFEGFALSVEARDEADADRLFVALAQDGQVQMPTALV